MIDILVDDYEDITIGNSLDWDVENGTFVKTAQFLALLTKTSGTNASATKVYTGFIATDLEIEVKSLSGTAFLDVSLSICINDVEVHSQILPKNVNQSISVSFDPISVESVKVAIGYTSTAYVEITPMQLTGTKTYGGTYHDYSPDSFILQQYKAVT